LRGKIHLLAEFFKLLAGGRDDVVRKATFGVEVFVDCDPAPFGPGHGFGNFQEPKKLDGQLLLKGFKKLIKLGRKFYIHRYDNRPNLERT